MEGKGEGRREEFFFSLCVCVCVYRVCFLCQGAWHGVGKSVYVRVMAEIGGLVPQGAGFVIFIPPTNPPTYRPT